MTIGLLQCILFISDSNSLKAKRMVIQSLKALLRNNFNVAVTEIDTQDKWQIATLAIVGVEKDRRDMNAILSKAVNFIERLDNVYLTNYEMEMI